METLQLTATTQDGKVLIELPDEFANKTLHITIQVQPEPRNSVQLTEEVIRKRREHFGKAPYPDYPTNKYDVYNQ